MSNGYNYRGSPIGFRMRSEELQKALEDVLSNFRNINSRYKSTNGKSVGFHLVNYAYDEPSETYYYKFVDEGHGPIHPKTGKFLKFTIDGTVTYASETNPAPPKRISQEIVSLLKQHLNKHEVIDPRTGQGGKAITKNIPTGKDFEKLLLKLAIMAKTLAREATQRIIKNTEDPTAAVGIQKHTTVEHGGRTFDVGHTTKNPDKRTRLKEANTNEVQGTHLVDSYGIAFLGEEIGTKPKGVK